MILRPTVSSSPDFSKTQITLTNLSFSELNDYAESEAPEFAKVKEQAESILKLAYPKYINIKHAQATQNYSLLLANLLRILPAIGFCNLNTQISPDEEGFLFTQESGTTRPMGRDEIIYRKLIENNEHRLGHVIENELFSRHVKDVSDPLFIRDAIFHYCHTNPRAAGNLLNKNIWKFWKNHIANYFIQYGADVNAKPENSLYPTLFHAIRSNGSPNTLRKLIEAGANYEAFKENRSGAAFTFMLLAALETSENEITVIATKFPKEVAATLKTLDDMLKANSDDQFSCQFKPYEQFSPRRGKKIHYSLEEIGAAKKKLLQVVHANRHLPELTELDKPMQSTLMPSLVYGSLFKFRRYAEISKDKSLDQPVVETQNKM